MGSMDEMEVGIVVARRSDERGTQTIQAAYVDESNRRLPASDPTGTF